MNATLTTSSIIVGTFTLGAAPAAPFSRNAVTGQLSVGGTLISKGIGPITRIRFRNANVNNHTVLYGDSVTQQIPLFADTATVCNERWEHFCNPEMFYFSGTNTEVIQFEIYY